MSNAVETADGRPFYWTRVHDDPAVSAPSGWYQWTERGLIYLGESILEREGGVIGK